MLVRRRRVAFEKGVRGIWVNMCITLTGGRKIIFEKGLGGRSMSR